MALAFAVAYLAIAVAAAVVLGRSIAQADARERPEPREVDLLADQPIEVLSQTIVDRRFQQIAAGRSTRTWSL